MNMHSSNEPRLNFVNAYCHDDSTVNIDVGTVVTVRVSCRRREMYTGHARLPVCLSLAAFPHYCTDPDVTWRNGRRCPLVVHYWADSQSMHEFRCHDNSPNAKCQRVLDSLCACLLLLLLLVLLLKALKVQVQIHVPVSKVTSISLKQSE